MRSERCSGSNPDSPTKQSLYRLTVRTVAFQAINQSSILCEGTSIDAEYTIG